MPELSPAAQAIVQPFNDDWDEHCLAAALEALADQVVPPPDEYDPIPDGADRQEYIREQILRIAAELRGSP